MNTPEPMKVDDLEGQEPVLQTKLFIPTIPASPVRRSRLVDHLQALHDRPLLLVIAPAGYGKTTLVSSWLRETGMASTWLSLDEADNDPIRFMQYFITALQKVVASIHFGLMGLMQGRQSAPTTALMTMLINEVSEHAPDFVFVLDDLHTIQSQPILDLLVYLIEHMPPQMHLALISRSDPPFPTARLRARGQLVEIRADQLRFTGEESAQFLMKNIELPLTTDDLNALEARTEGWIAGLQLAAISMAGGKDTHAFVSAFTGSHYYILDYLVQEVLKLQPEPVRSFLMQTSILDQLCGPLCEAVASLEPARGQAMLEALQQKSLFILPLDDRRRWFRYHHLFADVLKVRLTQDDPEILSELHRRASKWYEQNRLIFDAIRHSLSAGDQDHAAQLLDQNGCRLLISGEVVSLLRWIEAVGPYAQKLPWIAVQKAWSVCMTGQLDRAESAFETAERIVRALPPSDDTSTMMGALTGARAYRANRQGNTRLAAAYAQQALDELPVSTDFACSLRSAATSLLGDSCWLEGCLVESQQAYAESVQIGRAAGDIHMTMIASINLADVLLEQGKLRQAEKTFEEVIRSARNPDGRVSPLADRAFVRLGKIAYERNRLEDAMQYSRQGVETAERWGNLELQVTGLILAGMVERARYRPEAARQYALEVEALIGKASFSEWQASLTRSDLASLWMGLGDLDRAEFLLQQAGPKQEGIPMEGGLPFLHEPGYFAWLRLLLAQGEGVSALELSFWLYRKLEELDRPGRMVELLTLRALALQASRRNDEALDALQKALTLARPEMYRRTFIDKGEPMARLLLQSRARDIEASYVTELLDAIQTQVSGNPQAGGTFPSGLLTPRETEVLRLIEAGCTNQEIASKLVLSLLTVKRHISNIFDKLGVDNRTQAVSRAKEMNIIR